MAMKGLKPSSTLAWFLIEAKSNEFYFYIDPKNRVAQKYKDAKVIKKLLERYKIEGAEEIDDQAQLLGGSIARNNDELELVVSIKRNGAGSSLFKKALKDKTLKKIIPNASLVKSLSEAQVEQPKGKEGEGKSSGSREEEIERLLRERKEADEREKEAELLKLNEKEKKALKTHRWSQKVSAEWSSTPAKEENEEFFQTSIRKLKKFQKNKVYTLFDKVHWSKKVLGSKHPLVSESSNLLLTKDRLPKLIKICQEKLDVIELEKGWTDVEAEAAALFDEKTVGLFDEFSSYLEKRKFTDDEVADIINAFGVEHQNEFDELFSACSGKRSNVILLCTELAGGNWVYFRSLLEQIESY